MYDEFASVVVFRPNLTIATTIVGTLDQSHCLVLSTHETEMHEAIADASILN